MIITLAVATALAATYRVEPGESINAAVSAAFYLVGNRSIVRHNVISNIVSRTGKGGAMGYYFDEGSVDCVIISNYAYRVSGASVHSHMCRNITVTDNVLEEPGTNRFYLSFTRSVGCTFSNNRLRGAGPVKYGEPDAISVCEGNVVERPDGTIEPTERKRVPQPAEPKFKPTRCPTNFQFAALGIEPKPGLQIPFTVDSYTGQFDEHRYLEKPDSKPYIQL